MTMPSASDLASRLAENAEAVCRHYLSAGVRAGNYWIVGDVMNSKGRSLYVHLAGPRRGKWADAATGEYGDLLDLIRETRGMIDFRDVADEARHFLSLPQPAFTDRSGNQVGAQSSNSGSTSQRACRLFAMGQSLAGTRADLYLRRRGILRASTHTALRFHPSCYYWDLVTGERLAYPALIAAVTDGSGIVTGVHRTWLDPDGDGKAPLSDPRRSLGGLLGNAVRFRMPVGVPIRVMAAGEGVETILSVADVMPKMPMAAALSANHLAAFRFPPGTQRLYIARDADAAGRHGTAGLSRRAQADGIVPLVIEPEFGDFNEDLQRLGPDRLTARLREQLVAEDALVYLPRS